MSSLQALMASPLPPMSSVPAPKKFKRARPTAVDVTAAQSVNTNTNNNNNNKTPLTPSSTAASLTPGSGSSSNTPAVRCSQAGGQHGNNDENSNINSAKKQPSQQHSQARKDKQPQPNQQQSFQRKQHNTQPHKHDQIPSDLLQAAQFITAPAVNNPDNLVLPKTDAPAPLTANSIKKKSNKKKNKNRSKKGGNVSGSVGNQDGNENIVGDTEAGGNHSRNGKRKQNNSSKNNQNEDGQLTKKPKLVRGYLRRDDSQQRARNLDERPELVGIAPQEDDFQSLLLTHVSKRNEQLEKQFALQTQKFEKEKKEQEAAAKKQAQQEALAATLLPASVAGAIAVPKVAAVDNSNNDNKEIQIVAGLVEPKVIWTGPKPFVPRKQCTYYLEGRCARGTECTFRHDGVPNPQPPVPPQTKAPKNLEICKFFKASSCTKPDCPFSHDLSSEPCFFYHLKGACNSGEGCPYSHEPISKEKYDEMFEVARQKSAASKAVEAVSIDATVSAQLPQTTIAEDGTAAAPSPALTPEEGTAGITVLAGHGTQQ